VKQRYTLAPQAARDLVGIWRYVKGESSKETTDRVASVIRSRFEFLAEFPNGGHHRRDLTSAAVRFFSVYSYLIVYRTETKPLQSSLFSTRSATSKHFCRHAFDP
jgi:plasmid stabilization system protein ParE